MCNIAGYIGSRDAAPVLLEMIHKQEGLNGGFYSGLAIHDGQKLNYCKLRGDFERLASQYDLTAFPGTVGIIHSRTPSGGGDLWAHPFTAPSLDDPRLCYVANGSYGMYQKNKDSYNAAADRLVREGFDLPCKTPETSTKYNRLSTGESLHISDLVCQLTHKYTLEGISTAAAMAKAFVELPHEAVALAITRETPDRIDFCRINAPMFVGFDSSGAYLASSPTALPGNIQSFRQLPALSCGAIYCDRVEIQKITDFPHAVRGFNRRTVARVTAAILTHLEDGPKDFPQLRKCVNGLFPQKQPLQSAALVYTALYDLLQTDRIQTVQTTRTVQSQPAPHTLFHLPR